MTATAAPRLAAGAAVLYVGLRVPTPTLDGGSAREVRVLEALVQLGAAVTFAPHYERPDAPYIETLPGDVARLRALGVEVLAPAGEAALEEHLRASGSHCDLALLSPYSVADRYLPVVRALAPKAVVAYLALDLGHVQHFRRARVTAKVPDLQRALAAKAAEARLARACDLTLVCSEEERAAVLTLCPTADVRRLAHVVEAVPAATPFGERRGLLFLGSFPHLANIDAMEYFTREILPSVRGAVAGVTLDIVGADPRGDVRHLAAADVRIHGWVPRLGPHFARARVFVAPLRYGAGIKIKVLDSLARGVPAVLSPIAAEGIGVSDGEDALVAASPASFAAAVVRLHESEALWQRLAAGGRSLIERRYSRRTMEEALAGVFAAAQRKG